MKLYRNIPILLTVFVLLMSFNLNITAQSGGDGAGQESLTLPRPKARLFDEFTNSTCELTLMATDSLLVPVMDDPRLTGLVIIYGNAAEFARTDWMIRNWLQMRKAPLSRYAFKRGGPKGPKAVVQFWLVPDGADSPRPSVTPTAEDLKEPPPSVFTEPAIFSSEYIDEVAGCEPGLDPDAFAALLKANPKFRGNIVVLGSDRKENNQQARQIMQKLLDAGIQRSRIRTFSQKSLTFGIELWILP